METFNTNKIDMDEFVKGELTPEEMRRLVTLREAASKIIREIGELELRKAKLIGQFQSYEDRAAVVLEELKNRLGIPDGQAWQVSPDNKVRIIPADPVAATEFEDDSGVGSTVE